MAVSPPLEAKRPISRQAQRLIEAYRARVLAVFPGQVERVVLFGSRVRGEVHGDSDWDFAVYFRDEPSEAQDDTLSRVTWDLREELGVEIQSLAFPGRAWLAETELAFNIRDHGLIIYGSDDVPKIERPVLQHARDALAKAERFADQAAQAAPQAYETVVHGSYYAMFHGARAALLAAGGSASTKHGRVVNAFVSLIKRRYRTEAARHAAALVRAYRQRIKADYGNEDLTEAARRLRRQVAPFLAFCRDLVEGQAGRS